jgi:hypothetical protein
MSVVGRVQAEQAQWIDRASRWMPEADFATIDATTSVQRT